MIPRIAIKLAIMLALALAGPAAFAAGMPAPAAPAAAPAAASAPAPGRTVAAAPLPEVTPYNSEGVRDPFLSIVKAAKHARESKKLNAGSPLESYDLHQIENGLVAIIWDAKMSYALMRLPDGKFYTVREGMPLGIHGGKVYKILKDRIVVREMLRDFRGQMKPQDTIIMLHKEEG